MTREEAIDFAKEQLEIFGKDSTMYEFLEFSIKALEERPKGEWIKEKGCLLVYRCSNCKKIVYSREAKSDEKFEDLSRLDSYRYCPRCGADMRGDV